MLRCSTLNCFWAPRHPWLARLEGRCAVPWIAAFSTGQLEFAGRASARGPVPKGLEMEGLHWRHSTVDIFHQPRSQHRKFAYFINKHLQDQLMP